MSYEVIVLPFFARQFKRLAKKYPSLKKEFATLIETLETTPEHGTSLGNGCYKARVAITSKNKGKSGGARIITLVIHLTEVVYLLSIYDKSEQSDITEKVLESLVKAATDEKIT